MIDRMNDGKKKGAFFTRRRAAVMVAVTALLAVGGVGLGYVYSRWDMLGFPAAIAAVANERGAPSRITDAASLSGAVRFARDGGRLLLEPGRYDIVTIKGKKFGKPLVVASRDPQRPAVLTGLRMSNSSGIILEDLEFNAPAEQGMFPFTIQSSSNITLRRIDVHGSLDGNPGNDVSPIMIRGSRNITVSDSDFHEVFHGISFLGGDGLTFSGNAFQLIRTDGIRGGGASNLVIRGNVFTNFRPKPKDHPDGIQLWTTNTKAAARNILIEANLVMRGAGAAAQGVFIRDTFNQFPFENLVVRNNAVLGAMYNGLGAGGVTGGAFENNVVIGFPGQKSWIRIGIANDVRLTGNRATAYVLSPSAHLQQSNNRTVAMARDNGAAALRDWLGRGDNARLLARPLKATGLK